MRYLGLIAALLILAQPAKAETLVERAKRDAIVMVAKDDAEMAAAMRKARETLPQFLGLVAVPRQTTTGFAVKVAVTEGDDAEFFWITPFEQRKNVFTGRINNTPRLVKKVRLGQTISFREDEIVDWLYMEDGKMVGNFTVCILLKREPPEQASELIKKLGLRCDL